MNKNYKNSGFLIGVVIFFVAQIVPNYFSSQIEVVYDILNWPYTLFTKIAMIILPNCNECMWLGAIGIILELIIYVLIGTFIGSYIKKYKGSG